MPSRKILIARRADKLELVRNQTTAVQVRTTPHPGGARMPMVKVVAASRGVHK